MNENKCSTSRAAPQARASNSKATSLRLSDIRKLLKGRYGGPCRTADGERYLMAAIPELLPVGRSASYAVAWAKSWVPILLDERGEEFIREAWVKVSKRKRRNLTTDQLARLLKVADDEPSRLNLRCIPAASRNAGVRVADRAVKAMERARKNRAKAVGYVPRTESAEAAEPWKVAGISRRTWYTRRREERLAVAASEPGTSDLHCSVRTISDAPGCTVSFASDPLTPLRSGHDGSGEGEAINPLADNDNAARKGLAA